MFVKRKYLLQDIEILKTLLTLDQRFQETFSLRFVKHGPLKGDNQYQIYLTDGSSISCQSRKEFIHVVESYEKTHERNPETDMIKSVDFQEAYRGGWLDKGIRHLWLCAKRPFVSSFEKNPDLKKQWELEATVGYEGDTSFIGNVFVFLETELSQPVLVSSNGGKGQKPLPLDFI